MNEAINHPAASSLSLAQRKDDDENLISKVLELQEGLRDLLKRVAAVHGEHDKKRDENAMLQQYIANLMNSNAVRGDTSSKRKMPWKTDMVIVGSFAAYCAICGYCVMTLDPGHRQKEASQLRDGWRKTIICE